MFTMFRMALPPYREGWGGSVGGWGEGLKKRNLQMEIACAMCLKET